MVELPSQEAPAPALVDEFDRLYRQDGARMWRALAAYSGSREVAQDAVSEAFAQAIARGSAIRSPQRWVWKAAYRIAAGELQERLRQRSSAFAPAVSTLRSWVLPLFAVWALIVLVFDVETIFLFPWAVVFKQLFPVPGLGSVVFWEMVIFLAILTVGLAYIWVKGDLDWVKRLVERNGDLMVLLGHLLRNNPEWRNAKVEVMSIASN